jgi:hypothetical protein
VLSRCNETKLLYNSVFRSEILGQKQGEKSVLEEKNYTYLKEMFPYSCLNMGLKTSILNFYLSSLGYKWTQIVNEEAKTSSGTVITRKMCFSSGLMVRDGCNIRFDENHQGM